MRIDILHCPGCPTPDTVQELVTSILREEGFDADIHIVEVRTREEARRLKFPGSPTIRVNGVDVDAPPKGDGNYDLRCRVYDNDGIRMSWPSEEVLRRAILEAALLEELGGEHPLGCC